jgi:hypothetical protein
MAHPLTTFRKTLVGQPINEVVVAVKEALRGSGAKVMATSSGMLHIMIPLEKPEKEKDDEKV